MVIDLKRILTGIFLVFFILIIFKFKLEPLLILLITTISFLEFFKINIIKYYKLIFIYIVYSIFIVFDNTYINFFLIIFFLISISFSFYKNKFNMFFFIVSVITSLYFFVLMSIENRHFFYICIFISFFNDTVAYLSGNFFKGPKILPNISPKKTWSGTLFSFILSFVILKFYFFDIFLSILISLFLFIGDVYFSYFKRMLKIKDFSNIFPGHGGFFDRYDSIFFLPLIITFYYL